MKHLLLITFCLSHRVLIAIDKPDFSHTRDFCDTPFELQLTSTTGNSIIKYTMDGTKPDLNNGIVYTDPITITGTTAVRAVAIVNNLVSKVKTHTFIFPADIIHQDNSGVPVPQHSRDHVYWTEEFDMTDVTQSELEIKEALMDIPSMSIVAPYDSLFGIAGILRGQNLREGSGGKSGDPNDPNWQELIECSVEMIYPENTKFREYKDWQENAGIKIQGGGGRWNNGYYDHKQSFTLEFKSRYGAGTLRNDIFKAAPYNRATSPGRFDKIILRAGHNKSWGADWDRENSVYTRDQYGRDLQLLMSGWGSRGTFVHLYINGKYWGIYNPCERMDDNAMSIYFGGEDDDYYFGKGKGGDQAGNDDRYDYLCSANWNNKALSALAEYLDIDAYIDMCLLYCYANPGDGPQYYFGNRNSPAGPSYFTTWDIEDSFDGGSRRTGPPVSIEIMDMAGNDEFKAYFNMKHNADFKMKFADRAYKHCNNKGVLTDANAGAVWDSLCVFIEKAILCEIARWGDERGSVYDYNHWHKEWQDVKDDLYRRADKLIAMLKAVNMYPVLKPPHLMTEGQIIEDTLFYAETPIQLEIQQVDNEGTAYYTTDGNDPRNWDLTGTVSPTANQITDQSEMIEINNTTIIKARSKDGDEWSPLRELRIIPDSPANIEYTDHFSTSGSDFMLHQNYPNPFNPETTIRFSVPDPSYIDLKIYNITGHEIITLANTEYQPGIYYIRWDGKDHEGHTVPGGVYISRLEAGDNVSFSKMSFIK